MRRVRINFGVRFPGSRPWFVWQILLVYGIEFFFELLSSGNFRRWWRWLHPLDRVDPAEGDADFHCTFHAADYDDASWKTGKDSEGINRGFGYGEQGFEGVDIGTPEDGVRYGAYFRHAFTTGKVHANLELRCQRDDGIIVYLDGLEVGRANMGEGEESYRLAAASAVSGADETNVFAVPLEGELEAGDHILAISLHNTDTSSSDLRIGGINLLGIEEVIVPSLTGRWVDLNVGEIKIEQNDDYAIATGQNEIVTECWTKGMGRVTGNTILMRQETGGTDQQVDGRLKLAQGPGFSWD